MQLRLQSRQSHVTVRIRSKGILDLHSLFILQTLMKSVTIASKLTSCFERRC